MLQLGAGVSIFAYRSKLAAGFDYGFNQAMINYRNESTHTADDLDMIQRTVGTFHYQKLINGGKTIENK